MRFGLGLESGAGLVQVLSALIHPMEFGDQLGWAGLILALIGIAIAILWPTKRWIGWTSLSLAFALGVIWVAWLEFGPRKSPTARPEETANKEGATPETQSFTPEQIDQFKNAIRETVNNSKPPVPVKKAKDDKRSFSFAIDLALFTPTRDHTVLLYLASPGAEGMCIYPANLALYLRLQNLENIPSRLAGWKLELGYGKDNWVDAVRLDSRFGTIYFVPPDDPKHAGRVDSTVGFDAQLASKSYVLKPSEIVEGWALFQYPKAHPFFAGGYKLSVHDTLGHKWSGEVSWPDPKSQKDSNLLGGFLKFTGLDDVSAFHVKFADD